MTYTKVFTVKASESGIAYTTKDNKYGLCLNDNEVDDMINSGCRDGFYVNSVTATSFITRRRKTDGYDEVYINYVVIYKSL